MSNIDQYDLEECNMNLRDTLDTYKATRARLLKLMERQKLLMNTPPHVGDSADESPKTGT